MKKKLTCILSCLFLSFASFAQEENKQVELEVNYSLKEKGTHNLSFKIGDAITATEMQGIYDYSFFNFGYFPENQVDYWLQDYATGNKISTPVMAATYHYRILSWLELGGELSYLGAYQDVYDLHTMDQVGSNDFNAISALASVKFLWFNRKYISLYSGVSLGTSFIINSQYNEETKQQENSFTMFPAFGFTGIGIEAGADWYGFASIGGGTQGIFCAGFGYRFINKK